MNKPLIAILAVLAIGLAATGVFAFGFRGGFYHPGNNTAAINAINAGDYNAFLSATNNTKHPVNETQFNAFVVKYKQDAPIRDAMSRAQTAITNNDYTSWKQAMNDLVQLQTTQDKFNQIVQHKSDMKSRKGFAENGIMPHGHAGMRGWHKGAQNNSTNTTA